MWFDHGIGLGGQNIDLIMHFFNCSVKEALAWAREQNFIFSFQQQVKKIKGVESSNTLTSVSVLENYYLKKYLSQRGIFKSSYQYLHEVKFTNNSKKYYAIGFKNNSGGYELRNKFYKGCILKKDITTVQNDSLTVNIFEGFIDFLSWIELDYMVELYTSDWDFENYTEEIKKQDVLILNSLALLNKESTQSLLGNYSKINLYLDNDQAGIEAKNRILKSFSQAEDYSFLYRNYKDINDFLMTKQLAISV